MNTDISLQGPSYSLAKFAAQLEYKSIPEDVLKRARIHILDGLGLALASTQFPFAQPAIDAASELNGGAKSDGSIIGSSHRVATRDAAMVNGILIHGLDYDDTHLQAIVHPTAAVLPAVLALAEQDRLSGKEAMVAFCIGMEAVIRLGAAVRGGFHHTGFHATGVLAHFSSALAAGRLKVASIEQHIHALGIAASTASGVQVFLEEGAWTKRLHPGWAASAGITSATLARHGFIGPSRALEGRFGLFDTHLHDYAKDVELSYVNEDLGQNWMMADTALKPYPVCHFIHGAADAALLLREEIAGREIKAIEILLPEDTLKIVAEPIEHKRQAKNEYEAKFSAPFVVASTLLRGRFGMSDLTEQAIADVQVQTLAKLCSCSSDPDTRFPDYFSGGVKIQFKDGSELARHVPVNSGAGERKMSLEETSEKFLQNACLAIDESKAMQIHSAVVNFEAQEITSLMQLLRTN